MSSVEPTTPNDLQDLAESDESALATHGHPCHSCGAPVDEFDRFCNACGGQQASTIPELDSEEPPEQRHFRCKNCGSEVATDPDRRSYVCAFCDSTYVVEFSPDESDRQTPEFVIGFRITPEQAQQKFRRWFAANRWFRPGDLRQAKITEKLHGIYLPFWSFSMLAESEWASEIGEYWYRTETYTSTDSKGRMTTRTRRVRETEWWNLAGKHHRYYNGYLVSGSRGLEQSEADRIKPFQLPALQRYRPYFLAGWLSEEYGIERSGALKQSQAVFSQWEQKNIAEFLPGDTYRNLRVGTRYKKINSDLILLPVYLLSYRYGEKVYRFMINGQTGKVVGDKPLSWKRISSAIGIGIALAVLLFLLNKLMGG